MSARIHPFVARHTPVPYSATTRAHADGMRLGYVHGARAGRLAGFCWGLLIGAAAMATCFYLGWATP